MLGLTAERVSMAILLTAASNPAHSALLANSASLDHADSFLLSWFPFAWWIALALLLDAHQPAHDHSKAWISLGSSVSAIRSRVLHARHLQSPLQSIPPSIISLALDLPSSIVLLDCVA